MTSEREKQLRADYKTDYSRKCYIDGKLVSIEELLKEPIIQAFTGRVFCSMKCWYDYLGREGL